MKIKKSIKYIQCSYGGHDFSIPQIEKEGISIIFDEIKKEVEKIAFLNELWNDKNFNQINIPIVTKLKKITNKEKINFSYPNDLRILDMPIKFPGSKEYRVPNELKQFYPIIKMAVQYEQKINENINDYFCYITIDQKVIKKGNYTRKEGLHVDGFQGSRLGRAFPVDHSYIMYDSFPTIFYNQKFNVESFWDKKVHNYFKGFENQINFQNQISFPPYELLLINGYCLHESAQSNHDNEVYRTFLRISYTVREFDRLGNAHNPMFDYSWKMLPRNTQNKLMAP